MAVYAGQHQRRAQVGLAHNKNDEQCSASSRRAASVCFQSRMGVKPGVQEPGQKQDEHRLGDLRRLEGEEAAEADPAMGVMRVAERRRP